MYAYVIQQLNRHRSLPSPIPRTDPLDISAAWYVCYLKAQVLQLGRFVGEHAFCPLYACGIKKHPLVGGYLYTSIIVFSIGATAGVIYNRDVVHWWEGPL